MEQENEVRLEDYPRHVQAFAKRTLGRCLPQECGYFGYQKYQNLHIFGKTQEDVEKYINLRKHIRKNNIALVLLSLLIYIPAIAYGVFTKDFILVLIFACVLVIHAAYLINERRVVQDSMGSLEERFVFIGIEDED